MSSVRVCLQQNLCTQEFESVLEQIKVDCTGQYRVTPRDTDLFH